jgi:hypothetical protein
LRRNYSPDVPDSGELPKGTLSPERRTQLVNDAVDHKSQELIAWETGIGLRDKGNKRFGQAEIRVRGLPGGVGEIFPDLDLEIRIWNGGIGLIAHKMIPQARNIQTQPGEDDKSLHTEGVL